MSGHRTLGVDPTFALATCAFRRFWRRYDACSNFAPESS
jgi:hypothetical protein